MASKKTVGYMVAAVFCIYALVYKIPLPCFGCQKEGFWYRCVMGTGEGTQSCNAYEAARERVETAGRIMDEAAVYMDNLWDFTKSELPGVISDFIATLKSQILGLRDNIKQRIDSIINFLREKISLFVNRVKEGITTVKDFIVAVVEPMVAWFMQNILQPAVQLLTMYIEFKQMVYGVLWDSVKAFANLPFVTYGKQVVDIFKQIPDAMNAVKGFVVDLINGLKNSTIGLVNTAIRESIEGIEISINTLSGGIEDGANLAVDGLNTVKQSLVTNLNTSINGMAGGIETAVNGTTGGIETAVNSSVNAAFGVVNSSMNKVEDGVNGMVGATNSIICGAESTVNALGTGINTVMNGVEEGVNWISDGVADGINAVIAPVNSVIGATQTLKNVDLGINGWGIDWNVHPFTFIPSIDSVNAFGGYDIEIPDIPQAQFGQIDFDLDIPDVTFNNISIPDLDIPEVSINEPGDIAEVVIPEVDIPSVEIPVPADIEEDDLDFPNIPGFDFVSDKIQELRESITNIYENAMAPVYDGIASIIAFIGTLISSVKEFWREYMTWTKLKERAASLFLLVKDKVASLKSLIRDEVIPGFINLILAMKDPVLEFAQNIADHTWSFMKTIGTNVASIFNEAYKAIVKVTGVIAKGVFHTGLYIVGTNVERYTAIIPLPISVKMLLLVTTIVWMFFGGFFRNAKNIVNLAVGSVKGAAIALSDFDRAIDAFFGVSKSGTSSLVTAASSMLIV